MKNLKALIKSYKNEAKSDWAIAEDMADMYMEDANDAEVVYNFITESKGVQSRSQNFSPPRFRSTRLKHNSNPITLNPHL